MRVPVEDGCAGHGPPAPRAVTRPVTGRRRDGRRLLHCLRGMSRILAPGGRDRNSPDGTVF